MKVKYSKSTQEDFQKHRDYVRKQKGIRLNFLCSFVIYVIVIL